MLFCFREDIDSILQVKVMKLWLEAFENNITKFDVVYVV